MELIINSITDVETGDTSGNNFQGFHIDIDTLKNYNSMAHSVKTVLTKLSKVTYKKDCCT